MRVKLRPLMARGATSKSSIILYCTIDRHQDRVFGLVIYHCRRPQPLDCHEQAITRTVQGPLA